MIASVEWENSVYFMDKCYILFIYFSRKKILNRRIIKNIIKSNGVVTLAFRKEMVFAFNWYRVTWATSKSIFDLLFSE